MVLINKALNEVTVKLVYYGPGLCGKTTNLEKIYANPRLDNKGKMISMSTETDRTLFFDFMPMELGTIGGQKVRVQLYTVPGQVFYDATRKLVLRGADGVVFVADSQKTMRGSNLESLENLKTNLRLNRIDPEKVALVFQYNKRDLANADPVEEMTAYLKPNGAPVVEASAISGAGVTATLRAAVARILENLKGNVDISLPDAGKLAAPDMSAKSGVTAGSAGTPKLAMRSDDGGAKVIDINRAEASEASAPAFDDVGTETELEVGDETAAFDAAELEAAAEPFDDPFASARAEVVEFPAADEGENPFAVSEAPAESPFGFDERAAQLNEPEPLFAPAADDSPFGGESAAAVAEPEASPMVARSEIEALLSSARNVIESLEAALEAARAHERELAAKLEQM